MHCLILGMYKNENPLLTISCIHPCSCFKIPKLSLNKNEANQLIVPSKRCLNLASTDSLVLFTLINNSFQRVLIVNRYTILPPSHIQPILLSKPAQNFFNGNNKGNSDRPVTRICLKGSAKRDVVV